VRTIVIFQQVDDIDVWLESPARREVFGPLGITTRTFVDPARSGRVGLIVEVPSMAAFEEAMRAPHADNVRTESFVVLIER